MSRPEKANSLAIAIELYQSLQVLPLRSSFLAATALVALGLLTKASGQTIDVWGGDFPSDDITVATNWANQVVPAGLTAGSDVLMFNTYSNQYLDVTTSAVSFNQIRVFVGADYQGVTGPHFLSHPE